MLYTQKKKVRTYHFENYDTYDSNKIELYANNPGESCKDFEPGGMWELDVDREELGPSDEQIKIWSRKSKINQIID